MHKFYAPAVKSSAREKAKRLRQGGVAVDKVRRSGNLSPEQEKVITAVLWERSSVFFTGSAGVGKSFLLSTLRKAIPPSLSVYVTASTGIAACNVGGTTIHAWAGIGLGEHSVDKTLKKLKRSKEAMRRWLACDILIIDEISMIDGRFFEKLELIARKIRRCEEPFGGIQLILCGDFFQLPPVDRSGMAKFCFETPAWDRVLTRTIELKTVFRQKNQDFIDLLNNVRLGQLSPEQEAVLRQRVGKSQRKNDMVATRIFPYKNSVSTANLKQLRSLKGEKKLYHATDTGVQKHILEKSCRAEKVLELVIGAQVMLLRNLDTAKGLVNGARGVVMSFQTDTNAEKSFERLPLVRFENGIEKLIRREQWKLDSGGHTVASRTQVPLTLAWAISCHKCQGMTLEHVALDLGSVFEYGQAYVALSRVTSLEGLCVLSFNPAVIKAHPKVLAYYGKLRRQLKVEAMREAASKRTKPTADEILNPRPARPLFSATGGLAAAPKPIRREPAPGTKRNFEFLQATAPPHPLVDEAPRGEAIGEAKMTSLPRPPSASACASPRPLQAMTKEERIARVKALRSKKRATPRAANAPPTCAVTRTLIHSPTGAPALTPLATSTTPGTVKVHHGDGCVASSAARAEEARGGGKALREVPLNVLAGQDARKRERAMKAKRAQQALQRKAWERQEKVQQLEQGASFPSGPVAQGRTSSGQRGTPDDFYQPPPKRQRLEQE